MARPRRVDPAPGGWEVAPGVLLPERLRVCYVQDWVSADEPPPSWHAGCCPGSRLAPGCAMVLARTRCAAARVAFLRARGLGRAQGRALPALGCPRWRTAPQQPLS